MSRFRGKTICASGFKRSAAGSLCGEAVTYFDEVRCRTLADYYGNGGGKKEWWGMVNTAYSWPEDDRFYRWPIPQSEIDQNSNLSQNPFYNE